MDRFFLKGVETIKSIRSVVTFYDLIFTFKKFVMATKLRKKLSNGRNKLEN